MQLFEKFKTIQWSGFRATSEFQLGVFLSGHIVAMVIYKIGHNMLSNDSADF